MKESLKRFLLLMRNKTGHGCQRIILCKFGESQARRFLKSKGYRVIDKNYRTPFGELDIVACKDGCFIFVEVKTKSSLEFGLPEEAVRGKKILTIIRAARFYMKINRLYDCNASFGVISVMVKDNEVSEIKFIENAFEEV